MSTVLYIFFEKLYTKAYITHAKPAVVGESGPGTRPATKKEQENYEENTSI